MGALAARGLLGPHHLVQQRLARLDAEHGVLQRGLALAADVGGLERHQRSSRT